MSSPLRDIRITATFGSDRASHKLPDESLVIQPRAPEIRLEEIVAARRAMAA